MTFHTWISPLFTLSSPGYADSQPSSPTFQPHMSTHSGSLVVTAYDFESGRPGSNPEWGPIYYKALITAQGLPRLSSFPGRTLGTRAAEHKGCNWGMQIH